MDTPMYLLYDFTHDSIVAKSFDLDNVYSVGQERMRLFPDSLLILFKSIAHEFNFEHFEKLAKDWEDHLECIH